MLLPFSFLNHIDQKRDPLWVVVGQDCTAWSSTINGSSWNVGSIPNGWWRCVRPGGGIFMAVGLNCAAISKDGKTFTSISIPSGDWSKCVYMKNIGRWVVIRGQLDPNGSNTNQYLTSDDNGQNWTARTFPRSAKWLGLAYGQDRILATTRISSGNNHFYSLDAETWVGQSVWPAKRNIYAGFIEDVYDGILGRFASCTQIGANKFNITTDSSSFSWTTPGTLGTQPTKCMAGYSTSSGLSVIIMPDASSSNYVLYDGTAVGVPIGHTANWEDIYLSNPIDAPSNLYRNFVAVASTSSRRIAYRSFTGSTFTTVNDPNINNLELYSVTFG